MDRWKTEQARPGDGEAIADLFRQIPSSEVAPLLIWDSPLAGNYAEDVIQGRCMPHSAFFVIRQAERIGAAIALSYSEQRAVVDDVFVMPELRRFGLIRRLIGESLKTFVQRYPSSSVAWDFFVPQPGLQEWYRTLGAADEAVRHFWVVPLPTGSSGNNHRARCERLAEADQQHERWGFSSFRVQTCARAFEVGRLHAPYFRVTDGAAAEDEVLAGVLAALDSNRRMLLISDRQLHGDQAVRIASIQRVSASVERVYWGLLG